MKIDICKLPPYDLLEMQQNLCVVKYQQMRGLSSCINTSFLFCDRPPPLEAALLRLCTFYCCWMQSLLTLISSVASCVRMAAFSGQLAIVLIDTIAVSAASGIPHAVRKKGTLLRGAPSDLGV
ncbi:MAG: hypothetical protein IKY18_00005, partial [Oscillospiraceae bacterium]|nr:hypothetical protein [Oscillospiraceae bacterium]